MTTMTPIDFEAAVQAEREKQRAQGYDSAHDAEHGVDHLLVWAKNYARQGKTVEAAALIEAARELLNTPSDAAHEDLFLESLTQRIAQFGGLGGEISRVWITRDTYQRLERASVLRVTVQRTVGEEGEEL